MILRAEAEPQAPALRTYEWDAQAYHQHSDPQFEVAMDLMDQLELRGHEIVLDAGCGTGRLAEQLLHRLPEGHVIGVDASDNMVDAARDFLAPLYGHRVSIRREDLQVFCEPELAHVIFSTSALHFVADHRLLFRNFAKVLRPGGRLALRFASCDALDRAPLRQLRQLRDTPQLKPYLDGWLPEFHGGDAIATRYYLQEAGFLNIEMDVSPFVFDFSAMPKEALLAQVLAACEQRLPDAASLLYLTEKFEQLFAQDGCFEVELITVRANLPDFM